MWSCFVVGVAVNIFRGTRGEFITCKTFCVVGGDFG